MNYIYGNKEEVNKLLDRFCRYVKIWSESDGKAADAGVFPSTERQWDIAKVLVKGSGVFLSLTCQYLADGLGLCGIDVGLGGEAGPLGHGLAHVGVIHDNYTYFWH